MERQVALERLANGNRKNKNQLERIIQEQKVEGKIIQISEGKIGTCTPYGGQTIHYQILYVETNGNVRRLIHPSQTALDSGDYIRANYFVFPTGITNEHIVRLTVNPREYFSRTSIPQEGVVHGAHGLIYDLEVVKLKT